MGIEISEVVCGCVSRDARPVLQDILNGFSETYGNEPNRYNSLENHSKMYAKYGEAQVVTILTLLDALGFVEHSGSLQSSAHLTDRGVELREYLNDPARELEENS